MLFVFRTIFWLCIAMAVVPDRDAGSDFIADLGRAGSEAVGGFCIERPADCLQGAQQAVAIGQSVMSGRGSLLQSDIAAEPSFTPSPSIAPEPTVARVPLPVARPQG